MLAASPDNKRARGPKFIHGEIMTLVRGIEARPPLISSQVGGHLPFTKLRMLWQEVVQEVNALGQVKKTEWDLMARWSVLKARVKRKVELQRKLGVADSDIVPHLSNLEEKVLELLGRFDTDIDIKTEDHILPPLVPSNATVQDLVNETSSQSTKLTAPHTSFPFSDAFPSFETGHLGLAPTSHVGIHSISPMSSPAGIRISQVLSFAYTTASQSPMSVALCNTTPSTMAADNALVSNCSTAMPYVTPNKMNILHRPVRQLRPLRPRCPELQDNAQADGPSFSAGVILQDRETLPKAQTFSLSSSPFSLNCQARVLKTNLVSSPAHNTSAVGTRIDQADSRTNEALQQRLVPNNGKMKPTPAPYKLRSSFRQLNAKTPRVTTPTTQVINYYSRATPLKRLLPKTVLPSCDQSKVEQGTTVPTKAVPQTPVLDPPHQIYPSHLPPAVGIGVSESGPLVPDVSTCQAPISEKSKTSHLNLASAPFSGADLKAPVQETPGQNPPLCRSPSSGVQLQHASQFGEGRYLLIFQAVSQPSLPETLQPTHPNIGVGIGQSVPVTDGTVNQASQIETSQASQLNLPTPVAMKIEECSSVTDGSVSQSLFPESSSTNQIDPPMPVKIKTEEPLPASDGETMDEIGSPADVATTQVLPLDRPSRNQLNSPTLSRIEMSETSPTSIVIKVEPSDLLVDEDESQEEMEATHSSYPGSPLSPSLGIRICEGDSLPEQAPVPETLHKTQLRLQSPTSFGTENEPVNPLDDEAQCNAVAVEIPAIARPEAVVSPVVSDNQPRKKRKKLCKQSYTSDIKDKHMSVPGTLEEHNSLLQRQVEAQEKMVSIFEAMAANLRDTVTEFRLLREVIKDRLPLLTEQHRGGT